MKPRVLLIDSPYAVSSRRSPPRVYAPRAALYLATALDRAGYPVTLYDPKVSCTKNAWRTIFYVGDSFDKIRQRIAAERPDLIGVTNPLSKDTDVAIEVCRRAREAAPSAKIVLGGFSATIEPEEILAEPAVDIAAVGEGERTIVEIAEWVEGRRLLGDIGGIAYRDDAGGVVVREPREPLEDLDRLGFPDYRFVDLNRYFSLAARGLGPRPLPTGRRTLSAMTSRGCPFGCYFCCSFRVFGRRFRAHSAGAVLDHIRHMQAVHRIDSVDFEDDNLTFDRQRFVEIVEGLLQMRPRLAWATPNAVRADTLLDEKLLRTVKQSGCQYLTVGVESGNQDFLCGTVKKGLDLADVERLAELCVRVGIPMNAFFIVGFPEETMAQIQDTVRLALMLHGRYGVHPFVNYAIPFKGTAMYEVCEANGYLAADLTSETLTHSASFRGEGMIRTPAFTPAALKDIIAACNRQVLRTSMLQALANPRVALRYLRYALRSFPHVRRFVFR